MEEPEKIAGNRTVFPEEAVQEFDAIFLDEAGCRRWFMSKLYPTGGSCPSCGTALTKKQHYLFFQGKRVTCKRCGRWFNERAGTMLSGTHMTYSEAMLLMLLLGLGQSARLIADILGCDEETVRIWRNKLKKGK